jgi:hypothetical protein
VHYVFIRIFISRSPAAPDLGRKIDAASDHHLLLHVNRGNEIIMREEHLLIAAAIGQVPNPDALVITHREQEAPVWMEHQVVHPVVVANQCQNTTTIAHFPDLYRLVTRS